MSDTSSNTWHVLLVDDDEDDFFITQSMLNEAKGRPLKLQWAANFAAGLAALQAKIFDVVIVDYDLGGRSGIELIRQGMQMAYPAPFVLYTGRGNFEVDMEAMQAGATLNITKQGATPQLLERSLLFAIERKKADRALQRSEKRWRQLAEAMPNLVWANDADGHCIYASRQWLEYTGRTEAEQLGLGWMEQIHPEDIPAMNHAWELANHSGSDLDVNYRIRRHDGVYRWFKTRASPVIDEHGHVTQWFGSCTDVDDLVRAEAALQQRSADLEAARAQAETEKRRLEAVFEALPVGVAITGPHGGDVSANQTYEQIWGGPTPRAFGVEDYAAYRAWWAESGEPLKPEDWAAAQAVLHGQKVVGQMLKIQRFDGSHTFVMNGAAPIFAANGEIIGSAVAIQDISALRETEQQLIASEQKYRLLFNSMAEGVAILDAIRDEAGTVTDYRFIDINPAYETLIGIHRDQRIGYRARQLFGSPPYLHELSQTLATGRVTNLVITAQNTQNSLHVSFVAMDEYRAAAIFNDITEAVKAEAALHEREDELQMIMDVTPALISYVTRDFRYRRLNQNYVRWFNRPIDEMQGRTVREVLGDAAWERVRPHMEQALQGKTISYEDHLPYASGARDVLVTYIPHIDENGNVPGFVVHVVDMHSQKTFEAALKQRETELRMIMDNTPALVSYIDSNYRYRWMNQNYANWYKRPVEEMQGRTVVEVFGETEFMRVKGHMERALQGETITFEASVNYAGTVKYVRTSYVPDIDEHGVVCGFVVNVVDMSEQKALEEALQATIDRAVWLARLPGENPNPVARVAVDGRVLYCNAAAEASGWKLKIGEALPEPFLPAILEAVAAGQLVMTDVEASGRVYTLTAMPFIEDGYVNLYCIDVTDSRNAQAALSKYAELLKRSNRTLEEFAFIASHDLQEPLRKISAFGELLNTHYHEQLDVRGQDYIKRMQDASQRMQSMINALLTYSRVNTGKHPFSQVDLDRVARETLIDLEVRLQQSQGRVELGSLPVIDADPLQMRQLLLNLIGNALKFTRPGVPPHVRVSAVVLEGDWLELSITDNGIGIPAEHIGRLFQPFSRLHGRSQYEGAGLGLAICHKIVERHGGSIRIESIPNEGASFIVRLPCKQSVTVG